MIRLQDNIKGRFAETLIEELFTRSDYEVFRFGYEHLLPAIAKDPKKIDSNVQNLLSDMPDFVVKKKDNGKMWFIEVKWRTDSDISHDWNIHKEKYEQTVKYFKEVSYIYVTNKEPYIQVMEAKNINNELKSNKRENIFDDYTEKNLKNNSEDFFFSKLNFDDAKELIKEYCKDWK